MKKLLALALILTFILPPTLVSANRTRGVMLSGLRYDFDAVDERTYKISPTGLQTDTSGSWCLWAIFDTLSGADLSFLNITGIGDTRTGATFAQMQIGARRADATTGDSNFHISLFHRNGAGATIDEPVSTTALSTGTEYFICYMSSGTAYTLYINGVSQSFVFPFGSNTGDWFGDLSALTGTVRFAIGSVFRNNGWTPGAIDGKVDNEFITTDQLTQAQIDALYAGGKPTHPCVVINCANVRSFWKLGEDDNGSVTTTFDTKGNNHLTGENMENADIVKTSYY